MKSARTSAITCLILLLLVPSLVVASESCSMLGGKCQDACGRNEKAEAGDFEDCGSRQECCVIHDEQQDAVRCCIMSFEAKNFGPQNCGEPVDGACPKGSRSPAPCAKLGMCRERPPVPDPGP